MLIVAGASSFSELTGSISASQVPNNLITDAMIAAHTTSKITLPLANLANSGGAAGDLAYFNGTNWTRLAKGTAGQLLRQNSGLTAPEWTAPMLGEKLGSDSQAAGVAKLQVTGLDNSTYQWFIAVWVTELASGTTESLKMRVNDDATAGNYVTEYIEATTPGSGTEAWWTVGKMTGTHDSSGAVWIYAKSDRGQNQMWGGGTGDQLHVIGGRKNTGVNITSIEVMPPSNTIKGQLIVYGVRGA